MWPLQDFTNDFMKGSLGFNPILPVLTVHRWLSKKEMLHLLEDEDISAATGVLQGHCTSEDLEQDLKQRAAATQRIVDKCALLALIFAL